MARWNENSRRLLLRETRAMGEALNPAISPSCTHVRGHGGQRWALAAARCALLDTPRPADGATLPTPTRGPLCPNHGRHRVVGSHAMAVAARHSALHEEIALLGLRLHRVKRFIGRTTRGFDFLGYRIRAGARLRPSTEGLRRLRERARRLHEREGNWHRLL